MDLQHFVADLPVGREMILAAQPVIVDAGDVRHAGVDVRQGSFVFVLRYHAPEKITGHRDASSLRHRCLPARAPQCFTSPRAYRRDYRTLFMLRLRITGNSMTGAAGGFQTGKATC